MKAMTNIPRGLFDLSTLTPGTLDELDDREFRFVVDCDLKRTAPNRKQDVPAWISAELRGRHIERWVATLRAMLASVEGQLELREHELEQATTGMDTHQARAAKDKHLRDATGPMRFRAALQEILAEAELLLDGRVRQLEDAIRAHRRATLADEEIEPSSADEALWALLSTD